MITELSIKNLALIDNIKINFSKGLSVFTGETGAGKSVLMGAIGLLLGDRASSEIIRSGTEQTEVFGIFDLSEFSNEEFFALLKTNEIECDDEQLFIRRIIQKTGKNKILINQIPLPLSVLKTIGNYLIDLHGQHQHQRLLKAESANEIINALPSVVTVYNQYLKLFKIYRKQLAKCDSFKNKVDLLREKKELLEFQYNEIDNLKLSSGEEDKLKQRYEFISSLSKRISESDIVNKLLNGSSDSIGILKSLSILEASLTRFEKYDNRFTQWRSDLESVKIYFNELDLFLNDYTSSLETNSDTSQLDDINNKLIKIQRLKNKYSVDFDGILAKLEELKRELDTIVNSDSELEELNKELNLIKDKLNKKAFELSNIRKKEACKFDTKITELMKLLGFSDCGFRTDLIPTNEFTENGAENIVFSVNTNKGEPFLPLVKIASGGEISRIMLAIKAHISGASSGVPIMIFDEIDTGIGGEIANVVGDVMKKISQKHQLLVITHLHQIASKADNHYYIHKDSNGERVETKIELLSTEARVIEIARMLGGSGDVELNHAKKLLNPKFSGKN